MQIYRNYIREKNSRRAEHRRRNGMQIIRNFNHMTVKSQIIDKHTRCFVTEVVPWINEHAAVLTLPLTWELLIITFSYFLRSLQNSLHKIHHCASSLSICFCLHTKYVLFSPTFKSLHWNRVSFYLCYHFWHNWNLKLSILTRHSCTSTSPMSCHLQGTDV